jgi:hypothetical protein
LIVNPQFMHNPHYLDWARQNRTEDVQIENDGCDTDITFGNLSACERMLYGKFYNTENYNSPDGKYILKSMKYVWDLLRMRNHIDDVTMRTYNHDMHEKKRSLRVKILLKDITEDKWKTDLKTILKLEERNIEIHHILNIIKRVLNDFMKNFIVYTGTTNIKEFKDNMVNWKQSIETFRLYVNGKFKTIKSLFGITAPYITPFFKDEMSITQYNKLKTPVDSWGAAEARAN